MSKKRQPKRSTAAGQRANGGETDTHMQAGHFTLTQTVYTADANV